jgi:hypothetical protein
MVRKENSDFAVKNKIAMYAKNYAKNAKGIVHFVKTVVNLVVKKINHEEHEDFYTMCTKKIVNLEKPLGTLR